MPIVVTGTINKPKLSFKLPKSEDIGSILQGILGSSGDSKPQTESSASEQKTEAVEVKEVENETQPVAVEREEEKDDLEDTVKQLFKGLFK